MDNASLRQRLRRLDVDEEFTAADRAVNYAIIGTVGEWEQCCCYVYSTKFHSTRFLLEGCIGDRSIGLLSRYGLPEDDEISPLRQRVPNKPLLFLGDGDPFDVLIFHWLRAQLPMQYVGVSDQLLATLGVPIKDTLSIALPPEELQALALLREVNTDLAALIGPQCDALLSSGHKLELEAIVSGHTRPLAHLLPLLTGSS